MVVAGLGQCSLDYIVEVDGFPREDTKTEVSGITIEGGGPVATALVSLARLGVKTSFMGVTADDWAGGEIRKGLRREGVGVRALKTRRGGSSQLAFILVNRRNGRRTIFWQRPTVEELRPEEVSPSFIKNKSFLLLDGLMHRAAGRAAELARRFGVPVMLDAGRLRPGMLDVAGLSDYIVASEEFAVDVAGTPKRALKMLSSFGARAVTITLGRKGSVTWSQGRVFTQPAIRIKARDTTGAGDVFHGGYIYGLLMGWDLEKTVRFATAFAALKCRGIGGRSAIPGLEETLRTMKGLKG